MGSEKDFVKFLLSWLGIPGRPCLLVPSWASLDLVPSVFASLGPRQASCKSSKPPAQVHSRSRSRARITKLPLLGEINYLGRLQKLPEGEVIPRFLKSDFCRIPLASGLCT